MKPSPGAKALVFPSPAWCIGSYDARGRPNLMTAAWGGIGCSKPPAVAISLRKAAYTYGNIVERMAYTVGVPSVAHVKQADYAGMASGKNGDKFRKMGLTAVESELVDAP